MPVCGSLAYSFLFLTAYSGELCDADRDGCISGTGCYSGVTCTDNPAPAAGATCGLCPSGLTGDGVMCSGEKEGNGWHIVAVPNGTL